MSRVSGVVAASASGGLASAAAGAEAWDGAAGEDAWVRTLAAPDADGADT
ncbi:hypothetical protein OZ403_02975 [Myxococcus sp. NMCA1]|nr:MULTISPECIES: hypothetical protein [Myxococcus]WAM27096.1 hypothetical protein OZ403_02975 [Myxococcus sp. NMCA1]